MKHGISSIETNIDVERSLDASLSDEQIDEPRHTIPRKGELTDYGSDSDLKMNILKGATRSLMTEEDN